MSRYVLLILAFSLAEYAAAGSLHGQQQLGVAAVASAAEQRAERRIVAALAQQVDVDFADTPLSRVVDFWTEHGVPAQLDERALEDCGIAADTPIRLHQRGLQLGSALRLILDSLDLTWVIGNEVLLITTQEQAERHLKIRIYDLRNLVQRKRVRLPDGARVNPFDFDTIIDAICSTVAPETWDYVGGPGAIEELVVRDVPLLLVSQTDEVHLELSRLLANLHRVTSAALPASVAVRPATAPVSSGDQTRLRLPGGKTDRRTRQARRYVPAPSWSRPIDYE